MKRLRTGLIALALPAVLVCAGPAGAASDPTVGQVATALQGNPVYVDPSAEAASLVDESALTAAIGSSDVKVAVLPASITSGSTESAVDALSEAIGDRNAFTITVIGKRLDAAAGPNTGAPAGQAEKLARAAFTNHSAGGFTAGNVQGALVELIGDAKAGLSSGGGGSTGEVRVVPATKKSNSGAIVGVVVLVILLALAGLGLFAYIRGRNRGKLLAQQQYGAAKAEVDALYSRLASDVTTLNPGDNATAKQAMSDASERYNTAGSGMSTATTLGQLAAVRRTVIEGIEATRTARRALGLDPGADPAPATATGQQLIGNGQYVNVRQQSYQGYGNYQPGNPYYFGGGYYDGGYVPGGWYGTPFWEQLLITEAVFGGFGGWGYGGGGYGYGYGGGFGYGDSYGGGYNNGYDSGYNQGFNQGEQQNSGDWGANSGGGGDWGNSGGGGGGDWGNSGGGGGDWGGGGFGGGDFGGGGGGGDWGGGGGGSDGGGGW